VDVVVVGAPDDHSDRIFGGGVLGGVYVLQVGEGLEDALPVVVVFAFEVGPGGGIAVVHRR